MYISADAMHARTYVYMIITPYSAVYHGTCTCCLGPHALRSRVVSGELVGPLPPRAHSHAQGQPHETRALPGPCSARETMTTQQAAAGDAGSPLCCLAATPCAACLRLRRLWTEQGHVSRCVSRCDGGQREGAWGLPEARGWHSDSEEEEAGTASSSCPPLGQREPRRRAQAQREQRWRRGSQQRRRRPAQLGHPHCPPAELPLGQADQRRSDAPLLGLPRCSPALPCPQPPTLAQQRQWQR